MFRPFLPSAIDRYSRLFEPVTPPFDPKIMVALGCSMEREGTRIPFGDQTTTVPAGYTYFGQFIDHDITRDDTLLENAGKQSPAQTVNGGEGQLDLDHLYGEGPASPVYADLYEADGASFKLGDVQTGNGEKFDLPLNEKGEPASVDDRSSENIILRQVCVLFMKLHNVAVQESPPTLPPAKRFEAARERVRWQYQWLVREDYLFRICSAQIFREVIGNGNRMIDWQTDGFSIPVEFSQAAFRFGHSMVRPAYILRNHGGSVSLTDLFSGPECSGAIHVEHAVDWNKFLTVGLEASMAIDTTIAEPLANLPPDHLHHLVTADAPPMPPQLSVRTLVRGAATGLPTGEEVATALGRAPLRAGKPPGYAEDPWKTLDDFGLTEKTPLWYYVLLEAELEQRGGRLGTVGSRLVAEVIDGSLRADPDSFLSRNGVGWVPPPWKRRDGKLIPIRRLIDVAGVVGLA